MKVILKNCIQCLVFFGFLLYLLIINLEVAVGKSTKLITYFSEAADTTLINEQNEYAYRLWSQNPDSLIILSKETLLKSEEIQYPSGKMNAYFNLGVGYYEKGDYNTAISFYQQGVNLAKELGNYTKEANGMSSMTNAFIALGLHDEALEILYQALTIAEENDLKKAVAHILHNIGMVYHYQKKIDEAISFYEKSKSFYASLGDSINNTFILSNIGHLYLMKKDYDSAEQNYHHALRLAKFFKNSKAISNALISLGAVLSERGRDSEALKYFDDAKSVSESTGERTEYLRLLVNMSRSYLNLQRLQEAEQAAILVYTLASEQGQLYYTSVSAEILSEINEKKGEHKTALVYYKVFKNKQDSLDNNSNREALIRLEEKYRFDKSKQQIQSDHHSILNKKQDQIYVATLLILTLIILSILLYTYVVQKRKVNAALLSSKKIIETENINLATSNSFKEKLISIMAHDIREPVANVKMILTLLEEGDLSLEEAKELSIVSQSEIDAMIAVIDNLLLWVTDQLHHSKLKKVAIDLRSVVLLILDLYKMQAAKKGIELHTEINANVQAYADLESLKVIFRNLIYNAIKFCSKGDKITIIAKSEMGSEDILVRVIDTGVGMSPDLIKSVLANGGYSQLGTQNERGTGIGLQICREFIRANGSELLVKSKLGFGTEFWFHLPSNYTLS